MNVAAAGLPASGDAHGARELVNDERLADFDRRWHWAVGATGAVTAILRVRNEAVNLPHVLPPLFRSVERVVLVDNRSTDGTSELAARLATECGASERLTVLSYPFDVARCGSEHRRTPPTSVHSLTYFYNWSFSHAVTPYAMKWDGDMVLTEAGEQLMSALAWRLEGTQAVASFSLYSLWVVSDNLAYFDVSLDNHEVRLWPNRRGIQFVKTRNYESIRTLKLPRITLAPGYCFEIKRLSENEFDHWTHPDDFNDSENDVPKKSREWQVAQELAAGNSPPGVVPVEAEPGEHVIETVRKMSRRRWEGVLSSR